MRKIIEDKIEVKGHKFTLNILKSVTKGSFQKTKSGLWKLADENKFVYECAPCGTAFQLGEKMEIGALNREATMRFPCL